MYIILHHYYRPEFQYSCGRQSSLWLVPPTAKTTICTSRINNLARPKTVSENYINNHCQFIVSCGRESPIWRPSRSAMSCPSRGRTELLAKPKSTHSMYLPSRQVSYYMCIIILN